MHAVGPVTILNWSFPRKDITRQAQAFQLALAIRQEVADLEKAGCRVIQVRLHFHANIMVHQLFCLSGSLPPHSPSK